MGLFSLDRLVVIFPEEAKGGAGGLEAGLGAWRSGLQALKVPVQAPSASPWRQSARIQSPAHPASPCDLGYVI